MSAESKPVLVVTCPTPLASLPPDVAERVDRDYVVRRAETPESLTSDGLVELSDGASGLLVTPFDRIDASFFDRVADSAYEVQQFLRSGEWPHGAPLALMGRQLTGKVARDLWDGTDRAGGRASRACSGNGDSLLQPVAGP